MLRPFAFFQSCRVDRCGPIVKAEHRRHRPSALFGDQSRPESLPDDAWHRACDDRGGERWGWDVRTEWPPSPGTLGLGDGRTVIAALRVKYRAIPGQSVNDICYAIKDGQDAVQSLICRAEFIADGVGVADVCKF